MKRPAKKDRFHHGDLEHALVQATVELLRTRAVPEVSFREVARLAGVSSGAPYHHFASRADLLVAVALEGFRDLAAELAPIDRADAPPGVRFERRVLAYMRFAARNAAHYRVMFHGELASAASAADYHEVAQVSFGELVDALHAVRPRLSKARAHALAITVWSSAHGVVLLAIDGLSTALGGKSADRVFSLAARDLRVLVENA